MPDNSKLNITSMASEIFRPAGGSRESRGKPRRARKAREAATESRATREEREEKPQPGRRTLSVGRCPPSPSPSPCRVPSSSRGAETRDDEPPPGRAEGGNLRWLTVEVPRARPLLLRPPCRGEGGVPSLDGLLAAANERRMAHEYCVLLGNHLRSYSDAWAHAKVDPPTVSLPGHRLRATS